MFGESQNSIQITPRLAFIAGLVSGVLVLCTLGFLVLGAYVLRGKIVPGSSKVAGADISGAIVPSTGGNTGGAPTAVDPRNIATANAPFVGNTDAPLTMFYWRDFQCPYCHQFEQATLPAIIEKYVKTGQVKIYFKDFAFLGPDSQTVALVSRAVWESAPSRYFDWKVAILNAQGTEPSGWASLENVIAVTGKVSGIDANRVSGLVNSKQGEYQQIMDTDKAEAQSAGINGTPGFVIGNQIIAGAEPLANFEQAIAAQLQ